MGAVAQKTPQSNLNDLGIFLARNPQAVHANVYGETPLHCALREDRAACVARLLAARAAVDARTTEATRRCTWRRATAPRRGRGSS
mmetsp:Transcript_35666/g.79904  ORF Transcript_35666/g.79904 Transcript_35666/m.79904 type:complete len:86 (+) Transcript_35666:174-431(+)